MQIYSAVQSQEELEGKLTEAHKAHGALVSALTQAQSELAQLQDAQADLQQRNERLQADLEKQSKQAADDKQASEEQISALTHIVQVSILLCIQSQSLLIQTLWRIELRSSSDYFVQDSC